MLDLGDQPSQSPSKSHAPTCCFVFQNLRLGSINLRLGGVELQKQMSHTDPLFGIGRSVRYESCDFLAANSSCSPNEDFRRLDKASGVSFRGTLGGCEYSVQDGDLGYRDRYICAIISSGNNTSGSSTLPV